MHGLIFQNKISCLVLRIITPEIWISNLSLISQTFKICDTIKRNESHVGNIQFWFFNINHLVHLKCYILIKTPSQSDILLQRYEYFFEFKNNVKHKNLSPLLACNSKSIFLTSDSFPLIMSHMRSNFVSFSCLQPTTVCIKGIVSDYNNIFVWHKSKDINKNRFFSKISVDSNFMFTSYEWLCALALLHRLLC